MCCDTKGSCRKQEHLIGRPEDCTPRQIRECHGEVREHPCLAPQDEKQEQG